MSRILPGTRKAMVATAFITAAALSALAAIVSPAPAAAAESPRDYITLLVGSPHVAVYELTHDPNIDTTPPTSAPYELVARLADGTSDHYPLRDAQASLDSLRWSLSRHMLTTIDSSDHVTVNWWNLAKGATGTLTIPKASYVGADPHGVIYMTMAGALMEMTTAGATRVLSHPFAKRPSHMTGRSNATGVVISDYPGQARYLTFAHPNRVHHLRTGSHNVVVCGALGAHYAACTTFGALASRPTRAALISLSGKAPMSAIQGSYSSRKENFGRVGLIGAKTLAWTRFHGHRPDGAPNITVASRTPGADHVVIAEGISVAFGQVITAYGEAVVMTRNRHHILATDNGTTFTTIVTAPTG